jgi:hypothetical protein
MGLHYIDWCNMLLGTQNSFGHTMHRQNIAGRNMLVDNLDTRYHVEGSVDIADCNMQLNNQGSSGRLKDLQNIAGRKMLADNLGSFGRTRDLYYTYN